MSDSEIDTVSPPTVKSFERYSNNSLSVAALTVPAKKATKKVDYDSMTLVDLKSLCKEKGVKGYSTLKKAEIIELLKKA